MDIISIAIAKALSKKYTDEQIARLPTPFSYKGAVNYRADLDNLAAEPGHVYTVKYRGTSGTEAWGAEFAYGEDEGSFGWIEIGVNYDEVIAEIKAQLIEINTALAGKQPLMTLITPEEVDDIFTLVG